jgi:hypothetical protein
MSQSARRGILRRMFLGLGLFLLFGRGWPRAGGIGAGFPMLPIFPSLSLAGVAGAIMAEGSGL